MGWTTYLDRQTRGVIEHPWGTAFGAVVFGYISGERSAELFEKNANVRTFFSFILSLFVALWIGYLLARAIRQLCDARTMRLQAAGSTKTSQPSLTDT
jgi:hypothetical protein